MNYPLGRSVVQQILKMIKTLKKTFTWINLKNGRKS